MAVKLKLSTLAEGHWYEYAIRFVLGGAVTMLAGWIATEWGPLIGGLFLAFPAIFPASATLVEKHERERKENAGLRGAKRGRDAAALEAAGAALGSIGLMVFATIVWQFAPAAPGIALGGGALASEECCRCLLTEFGLAQLRRGCFGGWSTSGVLPLISSTPCRRMRVRSAIRDQFTRAITHFLATYMSRAHS